MIVLTQRFFFLVNTISYQYFQSNTTLRLFIDAEANTAHGKHIDNVRYISENYLPLYDILELHCIFFIFKESE
jgi:hypothetical protein